MLYDSDHNQRHHGAIADARQFPYWTDGVDELDSNPMLDRMGLGFDS
jgi:hypothetical protein